VEWFFERQDRECTDRNRARESGCLVRVARDVFEAVRRIVQ